LGTGEAQPESEGQLAEYGRRTSVYAAQNPRLSLSETEEPEHQPDEGCHQKKGNYDEADHVHDRTVAKKSLGGLG
jgi:hypothetical protein